MNVKNLAFILLLLAVTFTFISGQVSKQQSISEESTLRQMLASQPDYTALEQTAFWEGFGGFSGESKVIKLGNSSVEIKADTIFINIPGKPLIKVFPKDKTYAIMKVEKNYNTFSPKKLANSKDVIFKSLGTEKVGTYTCTKIEVLYKNEKNKTPKSERLKKSKFLFWSALELENLVIRSEITLGDEVRFITTLKDITLTVDKEYFRIPKGYKKIVY
jgi:hypothetical protein